jgi:hypothetical protein
MHLNGWNHSLKVTADGKGIVGHAGAVLLRQAAGQLGLTAGLSAAQRRKGGSPLPDRGTVLPSLAVAIALCATSMSDIALLAPLSPGPGSRSERPDVRRALDLAGTPRMLDAFLACWRRLRACQHPPDQNEQPHRQEGASRRGRSRCTPGHTGRSTHHPPPGQTDMKSKNRLQHDQ